MVITPEIMLLLTIAIETTVKTVLLQLENASKEEIAEMMLKAEAEKKILDERLAKH